MANSWTNLFPTLFDSRAFLEFASESIALRVTDLTWNDAQAVEALRIPRFFFDDSAAAIDDLDNLVDSPNNVSGSTFLLPIDAHKGFSFQIPYGEQESANTSLADSTLVQRTRALASVMDKDVFQRTASGAWTVSGLVNKATLIHAFRFIASGAAGNVPLDDRILLVNPAGYSDLLLEDDFVRADSVEGATTNQDGRVGRVLGFQVFLTNNLPAGIDAAAYHRSAIALAVQQGVDGRITDEPEQFAVLGTGRARWGAALLASGLVVKIVRP